VGLLLRTFWNLMQVDAGFDRARLVTFRVVLPTATYRPLDRVTFFQRLTGKLEQIPGVTSVAAMTGLPPLRNVNANDTDFEDVTPPPPGQAGQGPIENVDYYQSVSQGYVETMGIPVLDGRSFQASDVTGPPVVMVNESLARRFFSDRPAVGRRLKPGFGPQIPWFTIVGVLKDVKQGGLGEKTGTELYLHADQLPRIVNIGNANMNLVLRTALPIDRLAPSISAAVRELDPSLPIVQLRTMDDVFSQSVARPRFLALLLAIFAGLALALAAVGTYGVLSYSVTERRQEIGIRMTLGARRATVLRMILRQGLRLAVVGLVLGLAGSAALTRLMQTLLFNVRPNDPATIAAVATFMAIVATVACLVPAHRATRVDPMRVLREE
jgi:predicted permease